jgi:hypothetical protein
VHEEVADIPLPAEVEAQLRAIAREARSAVGAQLVTVSLWRTDSCDLVRVYSSRPHVYQLGGISSQLGASWVEQCVVAQRSFLATDESQLASDAFEHQSVLAALNLTAAVNAVIADETGFLGCLNLLDETGVYTQASVDLADQYAARLAPVLRILTAGLPLSNAD